MRKGQIFKYNSIYLILCTIFMKSCIVAHLLRLVEFIPMEASVMQEIGSPMYCLAVTRIVQTSSRRTVTRECSLKTTLSTRTDSSCRRHLIGAKRSSMVIACSFVSATETKHNRENSSVHCESKCLQRRVRFKFVKEFIAGNRLCARVTFKSIRENAVNETKYKSDYVSRNLARKKIESKLRTRLKQRARNYRRVNHRREWRCPELRSA